MGRKLKTDKFGLQSRILKHIKVLLFAKAASFDILFYMIVYR